METTKIKKGVVLLFMLLLTTIWGFSQNEGRTEEAKKAAIALTDSMVVNLDLTTTQADSVGQYNLSYALVLFTTVPLTDDEIKEFDLALDKNHKGVLNEKQYAWWVEKKDSWLDAIKQRIPNDDIPEEE